MKVLESIGLNTSAATLEGIMIVGNKSGMRKKYPHKYATLGRLRRSGVDGAMIGRHPYVISIQHLTKGH